LGKEITLKVDLKELLKEIKKEEKIELKQIPDISGMLSTIWNARFWEIPVGKGVMMGVGSAINDVLGGLVEGFGIESALAKALVALAYKKLGFIRGFLGEEIADTWSALAISDAIEDWLGLQDKVKGFIGGITGFAKGITRGKGGGFLSKAYQFARVRG